MGVPQNEWLIMEHKKKHMFDLGVTPILGNLHVGWSENGYTTQN